MLNSSIVMFAIMAVVLIAGLVLVALGMIAYGNGSGANGLKRRSLWVGLVLVGFAALFCGAVAFAEPTVAEPTAADKDASISINPAAADKDASISINPAADSAEVGTSLSTGGYFVGNDYVWAGERLSMSGVLLPNDLLATGYSIQLENAQVNGSVRGAGYELDLSECVLGQSATLAGYRVYVGQVDAPALAVAAYETSMSGVCGTYYAAASRVIINGTVGGDAYVVADSLSLGPNARIQGTLHAQVNSVEVDPSAQVRAEDLVELDAAVEDSGSQSVFSLVALAGGLWRILLGIAGCVLVALLAQWLAPRFVADAADMVRGRPAAQLVSGGLVTLMAPMLTILLVVLAATMQLAVGFVGIMIAMTAVGLGFAAASLSRVLFPAMGRWKAVMLTGAIAGACKCIPVVGTLFVIAGLVYLLGYVVQKVYLSRRMKMDVS